MLTFLKLYLLNYHIILESPMHIDDLQIKVETQPKF